MPRSEILAVASALAVCIGPAGAAESAGSGDKRDAMEVKMDKLGKLGPGEVSRGGREVEEEIGDAPLVLWSGGKPAAVLTVRRPVRAEKPTKWRIERIDSSPLFGTFPLKMTAAVPRDDAKGSDNEDDVRGVITADVDGDGVDDLVVVRRWGGVRVHGLRHLLFEHPAPPRPEIARWDLRQRLLIHSVKGQVLFLFFERDTGGKERTAAELSAAGASDSFRLLRVDRGGINPVSFANPVGDAVGFSVLSDRDGRAESIALLGQGPKGLVLTLYATSGERLVGPTNLGVPVPGSGFEQMVVLPGTTLAAGAMAAYVSGYDRATGIWQFDLAPKSPHGSFVLLKGEMRLIGLSTEAPSVLSLLSGGSRVWAVDGQGAFWSRDAEGWGKRKDGEPLIEVKPPGPGFKPVGVYPAGDGSLDLLAVYSRRHQDRELTHEELIAAAEQFLPPFELEDLRAILDPKQARARSIDRYHFVNPEDPQRAWFDEEIKTRLNWPLRHPEAAGSARYRNLEAFRAFLAQSDLPAQTVFTVLEAGRVATSFTVPGFRYDDRDTSLARPAIDWRRSGGEIRLVTALQAADRSGQEEAERHFYLVSVSHAPSAGSSAP